MKPKAQDRTASNYDENRKQVLSKLRELRAKALSEWEGDDLDARFARAMVQSIDPMVEMLEHASRNEEFSRLMFRVGADFVVNFSQFMGELHRIAEVRNRGN